MRLILTLVTLLATLSGMAQQRVSVVDSITREPLSRAAVFDRRGNLTAMTDDRGYVAPMSPSDYPLTVRCMGYRDYTVSARHSGQVLMQELAYDLQPLVVESSKRPVLHIVAYVREYSTLSSYTDTVQLFREKTVDFMLQPKPTRHQPDWGAPRVLAARSYYKFTNYLGLDSVSDSFGRHFSWSDWVSLRRDIRLPMGLFSNAATTDTVHGKYSPAEVWYRSGEDVDIDIDLLADTAARHWAPRIYANSSDDLEFTRFNLRYNFGDVYDSRIVPFNLRGLSFNIESEGRGRGLYKFFKNGQNGYFTTYAEIYVVDKMWITHSEAREWAKHPPKADEIGILVPSHVPALDAATQQLIARVEGIDREAIRLEESPDNRVASFKRKKYGPLSGTLHYLKGKYRGYKGK